MTIENGLGGMIIGLRLYQNENQSRARSFTLRDYPFCFSVVYSLFST